MSETSDAKIIFPGDAATRDHARETADILIRMANSTEPEAILAGIRGYLRVLVVTDREQQLGRATSCFDPVSRRIYLAEGLTEYEARSAQARELGYMLLFPDHPREEEGPGRDAEGRRDAVEVFVRALLMPEIPLHEAFARHRGSIGPVAEFFGVPPEDVVFRVDDLPDPKEKREASRD